MCISVLLGKKKDLGKKEVPHERDCRCLFVHHFVDFAGRHRGADAGTKGGTASVFSRASSSASDASVTTVSISYRAKLLLARASAEQSVVDQLQAQLDAFSTGGSAAALRGSDASGGLSGGMDLFEIISGAGNDSIHVDASNAAIDAPT